MTEIKEHLIKVFSAFISFCEEHNLTYYAADGTVLGAVRHHGFIPWDDDIDVHMPRADYKRLWELRNQIPFPYKVADISEMGYTAPFMKFMDMNSSIWEFEKIPYMLGVYIDIFPLDEYRPEDIAHVKEIKKKVEESFFTYFRSIEEYSLRELLSLLVHRNYWEFKSKVIRIANRKKNHKQVLAFLNELSSMKNGSLYFNSTDVYLDSLFFEKSWFDSTIDMPFETISIKIPSGYDSYLRLLYGDYMQLPPEEERNSHHSRYFISLERGYTIKEVRKLLEKK
jgi:lipopolysaccharide cholinephosphotransferase